MISRQYITAVGSSARTVVATTPMPKASEKALRQSGQRSAHRGGMSAQVVGERVAAFLRARHPHKTADYVACDVGISVSTVRKWIERSSAPAAAHFGLLVYAYGPAFLAAVYPGLSWVETIMALSKREAAQAQLAEAEAQLDALRGRP